MRLVGELRERETRLKVRVRNLRKEILREEIEHPAFAYREYFVRELRASLENAKKDPDAIRRVSLKELEAFTRRIDREFSEEHFGSLHDGTNVDAWYENDWREKLKPAKKRRKS